MIDILAALGSDPWRLLALTMMGSGLIVSGALTGQKVAGLIGFDRGIGTLAGLVVAVACGVAYLTA